MKAGRFIKKTFILTEFKNAQQALINPNQFYFYPSSNTNFGKIVCTVACTKSQTDAADMKSLVLTVVLNPSGHCESVRVLVWLQQYCEDCAMRAPHFSYFGIEPVYNFWQVYYKCYNEQCILRRLRGYLNVRGLRTTLYSLRFRMNQ